MATYSKTNLLKINPKWLSKKSEQDLRKQVIEAKKEALVKALKIPPAINQFNTYLNTEDFTSINGFLSNYKPETRLQRKRRLFEFKQNKKYTTEAKPFLKKGLKHVTKLIEEKKVKLVLIASDVNPIELVLFLPTLCKKMGVSYGFVKNQEILGQLVNQKKSAVVAIEDIKSPEFIKITKLLDSQFSEKYEFMMRTWGNDDSKPKLEE